MDEQAIKIKPAWRPCAHVGSTCGILSLSQMMMPAKTSDGDHRPVAGVGHARAPLARHTLYCAPALQALFFFGCEYPGPRLRLGVRRRIGATSRVLSRCQYYTSTPGSNLRSL